MLKLCDFVEVEDLYDITNCTLLRVVFSFQMAHVLQGHAGWVCLHIYKKKKGKCVLLLDFFFCFLILKIENKVFFENKVFSENVF